MGDKNLIEPPKLARRCLLWFLRGDLADEVQGDLEEKFRVSAKQHSLLRAKLNYWYQVLNYLRPFAIRKTRPYHVSSYDMLRNYFKISLRNLSKQKLYSFINVGGLTAGLSCFILILIFVHHEFSYDQFYPNAERVYRIYQRQAGNMFLGSDYFSVTPAKLAPVLMEECPEVAFATSFAERPGLIGTEKNLVMEKGIWADEHFFKVLGFDFIKGDRRTALKNTSDVVLTKSFASRLFKETEEPLGQMVRMVDNDQPLTVVGVINDPPTSSSLRFSYVLSIFLDKDFVRQRNEATWNNNSFQTFLLLNESSQAQNLSERFPGIIKRYQNPESYSTYRFKDEYFLQPVSDIHLQSDVNFDIGQKGDRRYVYLFIAIGVLVLVLASVNYMNLAVARSIHRAREVGVRKVMGAVRWQLIRQFWSESVLIAFVALLLAIGCSLLALPYFGELVERPLNFDLAGNKMVIPGLFLLALVVGLFSGNYPALFMSALQPVLVLKGKVQGRFSSQRIQRLLIVGQFMVSIALISGSVVIYSQLQYIQEKKLGYEKENIIVVRTRGLSKHYDAIRTEWLQYPNVVGVASSSHFLTDISSSTIINDEKGTPDNDDLAIYHFRTDYDFLKVFGIGLVAGRSFSPDVSTDLESGYILNETAAKALGWTPAEAIGKQFTHEGTETVIGVVKDFHMHSMHLPIQPLMIKLDRQYTQFISVKIQPSDLQETIDMLRASVAKYSPYPFDFQFLDQNFDQLYRSETKLADIFGFFTALSIFIAALGLFGLAAFTATQRTKEIGIRKTLGATVQSIVFLLSKDFLLLVGVSFAMSVPLAWYGMSFWLQDFAYRVELQWWMFAGAGFAAVLVAKLAIGYQSIKAATSNPVDSLRSE